MVVKERGNWNDLLEMTDFELSLCLWLDWLFQCWEGRHDISRDHQEIQVLVNCGLKVEQHIHLVRQSQSLGDSSLNLFFVPHWLVFLLGLVCHILLLESLSVYFLVLSVFRGAFSKLFLDVDCVLKHVQPLHLSLLLDLSFKLFNLTFKVA